MRPTLVRWCERTEAARPPPTRLFLLNPVTCLFLLHPCSFLSAFMGDSYRLYVVWISLGNACVLV